MIDRQHGHVVFECDSCCQALQTETSNFGTAWNFAKSDGWTTKKVGSGWVHLCVNCKEEF